MNRGSLFPALTALVILFHFFEHGHSSVDDCSSIVTIAAFHFGSAVRVLTNQFTLRLGALRLLTLPVTLGLFTDGFTFRLRNLKYSMQVYIQNSHQLMHSYI